MIDRGWLNYPSIRRVRDYLAAKNGGYEYVSDTSLLTSFAEPVYYFVKFLGYGDPESLLRDIKTGNIDVVNTIVNWRFKLRTCGNCKAY